MDPKKQTKEKSAAKEKPALTKAEAAKAVHRLVPVLDEKKKPKLNRDKEPVMKKESIKEDEVMNFAEYEDRIVVVTTSGEKLVAEK